MKPLIESILINPAKKAEGLKLYDYLERSDSAEFYNKQFLGAETGGVPETPDFSKVPKEMAEIMTFLKKHVPKEAVIVELGGSKHQRRSGYPNHYFEQYIPLDISYSSIRAYVEMYDRCGVVADACQLPFKDQSVDVIFTHTFLEHPLSPEKVLSEITRVLKPGGFVIHSDAWNCRWWQCYGVVGIKKFSELSAKEKLILIGAKITEAKLLRYPLILSKRALSILTSRKKDTPLRYKKLTPNYTLHLYKDEDAASSIDPVNLVLYYESRGFESIPPLSFRKKIFFKDLTVFLKKKS